MFGAQNTMRKQSEGISGQYDTPKFVHWVTSGSFGQEVPINYPKLGYPFGVHSNKFHAIDAEMVLPACGVQLVKASSVVSPPSSYSEQIASTPTISFSSCSSDSNAPLAISIV